MIEGDELALEDGDAPAVGNDVVHIGEQDVAVGREFQE